MTGIAYALLLSKNETPDHLGTRHDPARHSKYWGRDAAL